MYCRVVAVFALFAVVIAGCDDSGPSSTDVSQPADDPVLGDVSLPLTHPEPPALTPCPDGWTEAPPADDEGVAVCEPWPDGSAESCEPDEAHFVGESGCVVVGSACPAGDWAEGLPDGQSVLYVRVGAENGDGTPTAPFGSISEALASAGPGSVVALARGTYDETPVLTDGVTLWGACVAETRLAPGEAGSEAALTVEGVGVDVRNLRITGERPGLSLTEGASASLNGVVIDAVPQLGLSVASSASLTAEALVVRNVRYDGEEPATAVLVAPGANVSVRRAVIAANEGVGVMVGDLSGVEPAPSAVLDLTRVAVRETHAGGIHEVPLDEDDDRYWGIGLLALGGEVTVRESLFECDQKGGLVFERPETHAHLDHVVVRGDAASVTCPLYAPGPPASAGLFVGNDAVLIVERALFEGNRGAAITIHGSRNAFFRDTVVRDVRGHLADTLGRLEINGFTGFGFGLILVWAGAELERVVFERTTGAAMLIGYSPEDPTGDAELGLEGRDVVIRDADAVACSPEPCPHDGEYGMGVVSFGDALATLDRFVVTRSALCGLQLALGGTARLTEGLVSYNPIGVNVQTEGLDFAQLTDRVYYVENGRNLDSQELPVPLFDELSGGDEDPGNP